MKKHPSSTYLDNKDRIKLEGYRDELQYKYGLFLKLYKDYKTTLKYLQTNLLINNSRDLTISNAPSFLLKKTQYNNRGSVQ